MVRERASLLISRKPDEIRVAETFADLGRLRSRSEATIVVPAPHLVQPDRDQEIAALDAVLRVALEQPLGASEPARRAGRVSAEEKIVADPEGTTGRTWGLAGPDVHVMRALESGEIIVVVADHVCRPREQLEILCSERLQLIGARQRLVRIQPR